MAIVAPRSIPTRDDAAAAAAVLVDKGVAEVLLFGSVADGTATPDSDIDLVAIFADLDYANRAEHRRGLEAAAGAAVPWPVQVHLTDRPEWQARVQRVPSSFEARIAAVAVPIAAAVSEGAVDWGKEMVLPMSDSQEALGQFRAWVLPALAALANDARRSITEEDPAASLETHEQARLDRMVRVCAAAAKTTETSLIALAVLYATPTQTKSNLQRDNHKIPRCIAALQRAVPEPAASAVREVFDRHGIDLGDLSRWREDGMHPDDADEVRAAADRLAPIHAAMAPEIAGVVADHLQYRLDPAEAELEAATARRTRLAARIATQDVRFGVPLPAGVDL